MKPDFPNTFPHKITDVVREQYPYYDYDYMTYRPLSVYDNVQKYGTSVRTRETVKIDIDRENYLRLAEYTAEKLDFDEFLKHNDDAKELYHQILFLKRLCE